MDGQGDHTMSREASGEVDVDQVPVRLLAGKQAPPAAAPTNASEDAELAQFSPDTDSEAENIVNQTTTQMGHAHRRRQRVGAVAGIALLVVLAAGVAVAVLVSNASKPKIALPEEFSGSFATADAYNPDVRYAGRVHKRVGADGRAEFEAQITHVDPFSGNRMVYTLLNHRAYVQVFNDSLSEDVPQRVYCYPEEQFPPVGDVEQLLKDASVVPVDILDANNPGMAPCLHSGNRWLIKWGRQHFVICRPENDVHRLVGDNFNADFVADATVTPLNLAVPTNVTDGMPARCEAITEISALGDTLNGHHGVEVMRRRLGSSTVTVTSSFSMVITSTQSAEMINVGTSRVPCVFVGGIGYDNDHSPRSTSGNDDYWGGYIQSYLDDYCSSYKFLERDMRRSWDDMSNADHFCHEASFGTGTIGTVLIFSHGSGSLVVANALNNNRCQFSGTTRWYSAMAPWGGARAANQALTNVCPYYNTMSDLLSELDFCKGRNHDRLHNSIETIRWSYMNANSVTAVAQAHLDGAMCGHSSQGIDMGDGQQFQTVDDVVNWGGNDRDGLMLTSSCMSVRNSGWAKYNPSAQWANMHINYLDGTTRYGDAYVDPNNDKSPCKWYRAMAARF